MSSDHPITPPDELVREWSEHFPGIMYDPAHIATQAARWGADQEMEACLQLIQSEDHCLAVHIRAARRPKPPNLKEQALNQLDLIPTHDSEGRTVGVDVSILRRALEALPE